MLPYLFRTLFGSSNSFSRSCIFLDLSKTLTEQANFLGSIGTAQRNKELEPRVLKIARNLEEEIEEKSGVETSF